MSFRRSNESVKDARRWRLFLGENVKVIETAAVPESCCSTLERFQDLLMHGYLDNHRDPTGFIVDRLSPLEREAFSELVDLYFAAGYPDPGLMAVSHEERLALAQKYPDCFDSRWRLGAKGWAHEQKNTENVP